MRKGAHPSQSTKRTLDLEHQPVGLTVKIRVYTFISRVVLTHAKLDYLRNSLLLILPQAKS